MARQDKTTHTRMNTYSPLGTLPYIPNLTRILALVLVLVLVLPKDIQTPLCRQAKQTTERKEKTELGLELGLG